jgi:hypothetical protein
MLAFHQTPGECGSLFAEVLNGLIAVFSLGRVHTNETHTFTVSNNNVSPSITRSTTR